MGMTEEKLIKGSDAKGVLFRRYRAISILNRTGVLYNGLLTGGKSDSGHDPQQRNRNAGL